MFYKPKFCCSCGEKIERRDWKPWNSTRFCELCETDHTLKDWLPRSVVAIGLIGAIFGLGTYLQKKEPPLNITRNAEAAKFAEMPASTNNAHASPVDQTAPANSNSSAPAKSEGAANQNDPPKLLEIQQNTAADTVYFCGARTKKGKPCTRLVKGGGRCWQHKGKPAMMPQEKLVAGK